MNKEISQLHRHIGRSKIAIFVIVGFLTLITYLLITISQQLADTSTTLITQKTEANEPGFTPPVEPSRPIPGSEILNCNNYQYAMERLEDFVLRGQRVEGQALGESGPGAQPDSTQEGMDLYRIKMLIEKMCRECPDETATDSQVPVDEQVEYQVAPRSGIISP